MHRTKTCLFAPLAAALTLSACAGTGGSYVPVVDGTRGPSFNTDLAQCQQLAQSAAHLNRGPRDGALAGAGIGAIAGWAEDDAHSGDEALAGAVVGALAGAGAGLAERGEARQGVIVECMRGRGHAVVG